MGIIVQKARHFLAILNFLVEGTDSAERRAYYQKAIASGST